jgi:hypothetical protein
MTCCGKHRDDDARRGGCCRLCKIWEIITREPKTPYGDPCVTIPGHIVHKPDPCIYSQFLLMKLEQPVTWDNPDVRIFLNGVEQDTYNLTAGTDYDIEITVHNSSREKPANGTTVDARWIDFGAGGQTRHAIDTLTANVPIWPGTDLVSARWRTPDVPGHYCIEVELSHPNDGNPSNNLGWNNTQVHAANSPVTRPIRIFNRYPRDCPPVREGGGPHLRPRRALAGWGVVGAVAALLLFHAVGHDVHVVLRFLGLLAAGYAAASALGLVAEALYAWSKRRQKKPDDDHPRRNRVDCHMVETEVDSYSFNDHVGKDFDPKAAFQGQAPTWPARVEPPSFVFAPGEAFRDVDLIVDAPDDQGPPGVFNVNVRQGGVPSGGVTITITRGGP